MRHDKFAIFGTGYEAVRMKSRLNAMDKDVIAFLDNSCRGQGRNLENIPVVHPTKFDFSRALVLVASLNDIGSENFEISVSHQLVRDHRLRPFKDFAALCGYFVNMEHFDRYKHLMGKRFYSHFVKYRAQFSRVRSLLSDARSKDIYTKVIDYKLRALEQHTIDIDRLPCPPSKCRAIERNIARYKKGLPAQLTDESRTAIAQNLSLRPYSYYNKIRPENKAVIMDIGAFNGDTAGMFAVLSPGASVYAFEPVNELFPKVKAVCDVFHATAVQSGVFDKTGTIRFTKLRRKNTIGMGSFAGSGADSIPVVSLDDFVRRRKIAHVDFIKMDIEGSEIKALEGAKNTIKAFRPDLAICIYHTIDHLWKIPLLIKRLVPDYELYIDHKHIHPAETVCYATCPGLKTKKRPGKQKETP